MIRLGTPFLIMVPLILCSPALAARCDGNPFNIRDCKVSDFAAPFNTPAWYVDNPAGRDGMIRACTKPTAGLRPPPRAACEAAFNAAGIRRPAR